MATLSGQTIANTYQGLLKLDDSSQGVTSTLQPLQDGLGNNVGGAQYNNEVFKTTSNFYQPQYNYKFKYYGVGLGNNPYSPVTDLWTNTDRYTPLALYDMGINSYSGITFWVNQQGTIGEPNLFQFAIYDARLNPTLGIIPNNRLTNVYTLDPQSPLGELKIDFGTNIKITTGYYFFVITVYNTVTPTFLLKGHANNTQPIISSQMLGLARGSGTDPAAFFYFSATGTLSNSSQSTNIFTNIGFPSQYTDNDLELNRTNLNTGGFTQLGFLFNTVI